MAEQLNSGLIKYLASLEPLRQKSDKQTWVQAREIDSRFIMTVLELHSNLIQDQALVLGLDLSGRIDESIYGGLERYASLLMDAPSECLQHIRELQKKREIIIEGVGGLLEPDTKIELSIPPNVFPTEDLGDNTSASRAALLGGDVKRFLKIETVGASYFKVNPSGLFLGNDFVIHPSVIRSIRLGTLHFADPRQIRVQFRAV